MMRPIPKSHSRSPLDAILGNVSGVRVLRTLSRHGGLLSAPVIADQAQLTRMQAHLTLQRLVAEGVVERQGSGKSRQYRVAPKHWLAAALRQLFDTEAGRMERVFGAMRKAAMANRVHVGAAWLYGSVARGDDTGASDIDMAIVVTRGAVTAAVAAVRTALVPIEAAEGVTISVLGFSQADIRRLPKINPQFWGSLERDAVPLVGDAPRRVAHQAGHRPSQAMVSAGARHG